MYLRMNSWVHIGFERPIRLNFDQTGSAFILLFTYFEPSNPSPKKAKSGLGRERRVRSRTYIRIIRSIKKHWNVTFPDMALTNRNAIKLQNAIRSTTHRSPQ